MTSILDSFRDTFGDRFSFFKIATFATPIYFAYTESLKSSPDASFIFWLLVITIFFLFGFLVETTSNVINERNSVMPSLNPFKLVFSSIKGVIAVGPVMAFSVFVANYFIPMINIVEWLDITMKTIIWIIVVAVTLAAFLMFVKNEKVLDAYNLKILSDKSGDMMVGIVFYVLQLAVMNIPTTLLLGYILNFLFGLGPVVYGFLAYALVFNLIATAHYMAQLQYEVFGVEKKKF